MKTRNTKAKALLLETLQASATALSQDVILKEMKGEVNRATIYRILNRYCEEGKIHKTMGDDGKQYFALCKNCASDAHKHHHFHFRCLVCHKVECLPNEVEVSLPEGYVSETFNGFISGKCANCN